ICFRIPPQMDGLIRKVVVKVVVRLAHVGIDRLGAFGDRGAPLVRVAADEAVKVLEAQTGWPQIEWACLARLPVGNIVVFAKPGGVPALLLEYFGDGGGVPLHRRDEAL